MPRPIHLSAAILACAALTLGACSSSGSDSASTSSSVPRESASTKVIRIGLEAPLTGDQKAVGLGMLAGARLAASEINEAGGVDGKTIRIVPIDDAADPATGVRAAKAAIDKGLDAVVGPYNSGVGSKTLPLYLDAGVVPLRLTSADSTQGLGFTLQPMTSQIAPVATKAITDWVDAGTVALIYDTTQEYTVDANKAMQASLDAAGVEVTTVVGVEPGKSDYSAAVETALAGKPDLVYLVTYYPEGGLLAKAMLDAGTSSRCLADFGAYDNAYVEAGGLEAAHNCPVVGVPAPADFPGSKALVDAYRAANDEEPGTWAPYAYDSVEVLARAALAADDGTIDAEGVAATKAFTGWTGTVRFEAKSGNRIPAPVVVVSASDDGSLHIDRSWISATGFTF